MSGPDYVETARYNLSLSLHSALAALSQQGGQEALHYSNACVCYRVLAVCSLLLEADVATFSESLCKAGQVRLAFLQFATQANHSIAPKEWLASDNVGFSDALAAGDLDTARSIARLSPAHHRQGFEYEEDFFFSRFLQLLSCAPQESKAHHDLLERWCHLPGWTPEAKFDVCRALQEQDQDAFSAAFQALLEERQRELAEYRKRADFDPEVGATTARIYVDGLAVLRLAEFRGLHTQPHYPLIPQMARLPLGMPLPPPGSWQEPP